MRKVIALLFSVWLLGSPALALTVQDYLPNAQKVGEGRLTYMFWDVYDAQLYAPEGEWNPDKPFALTLHYLRALDGDAIADRSVEEMRKQGYDDEVKLAAWHSQMREIFPDVVDGTELTGLHQPGEATKFYKDGQLIGSVRDTDFGRHFFDIWLSERTTEPKLRRKLLGLAYE